MAPRSNTRWLLLAISARLILSANALAAEDPHADAVRVFHCDFGEQWDVNYDRWPDRWIRKTGPNYPHYVNIEIQDDAAPNGGRCLVIDLDGASAAVASPPIRVMSRFGYVFQAQVKAENLAHSVVQLTLEFYDKAGRLLQTKSTAPFSTTGDWQRVALNGIELSGPEIDRAVINLVVLRGSKGDLKGRVSLADVWLARKPRIAVSTNNSCNVYPGLDDVVVRCELSGIRERDPEIRFQLLDEAGRPRDSASFRLDGRLIVEDPKHESDLVGGVGPAPAGYEGQSEWRPKVPDYGFYRVVVQMLSSQQGDAAPAEREIDSRTVWLAIVPPLSMPKQGEFGWTLPQGDDPLSFQELSRLLPQVGVNWIKVPAWFDANDPRRGDDLISFVELIGASNIEVVGVIDRPPHSAELDQRLGRNPPIADLLSLDSSSWSPALEPVMTRLSLRVRWWQLGRDDDTSFVGFPNLNKRISELRTQLFRFGQDVRLGLSWDWSSANQEPGRVAWDFEQLHAQAPLSEQEFAALLAQPRTNSAERWVVVEPPPLPSDEAPREPGALTARTSAFVRRLVAAKEFGADRIFIAHPFHDELGLMRSSGMPAELLLPWRTTAAMLGGAKMLGKLELPALSENRVFLRPDGKVVMVVWNETPTQEVLYLGPDVQRIDVWGRMTTPTVRTKDHHKEQVIDVGPTPTFVLGLHEAITRWRMATSFADLQVPSVFAKAHPNSLRFRNFFPQGVGGSLRIVVAQEEPADDPLPGVAKLPERSGFTPDRWSIEPPQKAFQVAADEGFEFPFDIRLKNALYGTQPVRIEFTVEADEPYKFSVYRRMEVGTKDLTLKVRTHVDQKDGSLIVEQLMSNKTERVADFRCYLYAKGRRRQRAQVYRLGANRDRKIYRYPSGMSLVGQEMLLEIEELNGPRVIKHRFIATETSPNDEPDEADQPESDRDELERVDTRQPRESTIGWGAATVPPAG